jgi:hypothetical protein
MMNFKNIAMKKILLVMFTFCSLLVFAQLDIPASYSNLKIDGTGKLQFETKIAKIDAFTRKHEMTLSHLTGNPKGGPTGLDFNFNMQDFNGTLYFGFIPLDDARHSLPVYFRNSTPIEKGIASINIKEQLSGKFDMINWSKKGKGLMGYRVSDAEGKILYDGKVAFSGSGPFQVATTIIEGPFVNQLTEESCVISFTTNRKTTASIEASYKIGYDTKTREYTESAPTLHHEILLNKLVPETEITYSIRYGGEELSYSFTTPPKKGSRKAFTFAYASDSRHAMGGGERNVYGTNAYIMKKIMALATYEKAAFMQFTGDMVNGYCIDKKEIEVQYANWKRSIEAFAHYMPVYVGMGNHECVMWLFIDETEGKTMMIDKFPYETESSEALFAKAFVNFENGPDGEDGSIYDPDPRAKDFPSYKENVYYYVYDNVAMVVLNSDYWYAPSLYYNILTSGNLHGYLMDNQMQWLRQTLKKLEADKDIDHIFITQHTPAFPNGGHVEDDMWYNGNNLPRAVVGGTPVKKGVIERRDEYLKLIINESPKVAAILTGDEHNYNKLELGPETEMYPNNYKPAKISLNRSIYQINNGAAGAPYYAQEVTPWTPKVTNFSTQNALVLIDVEGTKVSVRVLNPDTLEKIDAFVIRE